MRGLRICAKVTERGSSMPKTFLPASVFYQDPAHCLSRGGKEMATVIPMLPLAISNEAPDKLRGRAQWVEGFAEPSPCPGFGQRVRAARYRPTRASRRQHEERLAELHSRAGNFVHGVRITGVSVPLPACGQKRFSSTKLRPLRRRFPRSFVPKPEFGGPGRSHPRHHRGKLAMLAQRNRFASFLV